MKEIHHLRFEKVQPAACWVISEMEKRGEVDSQRIVLVNYGPTIGFGPLLKDQADMLSMDYVDLSENPLAFAKWA